MRFLRHNSSFTAVRAEIRPGVWIDSRLALWLAEERLLVVADLHWGYAASHRARGNLVPFWGDDEIERQLRSLIADYHPAEMLWLGDIVHAAEGGARAAHFIRETRPAVPITLIAGNHDRRWLQAASEAALGVTRGKYFFHHGHQPAADRAAPGCVEVIGHHHPAVICRHGAGSSVKVPALVASAHQLILPAFSPWSDGTPWSAGPGTTLWALSPKRIFALPAPLSPTPSVESIVRSMRAGIAASPLKPV